MTVLALAVQLIVVHMIDGREVVINPKEIVRMQATGGHNKQIPDAVECVIWFTDGKFLSVAEPCSLVQQMMERIKP